MHTRHIHSFVHQRDATDNGLIHLSYVKASAALDFFDNVYPLLISEECPSLYSPVPLPEPLRATLPLNSTLRSFVSLTSRRRPELYRKKKTHNLNMCEVWISNNRWQYCCVTYEAYMFTCMHMSRYFLPHYAIFLILCFIFFSFKCNPMPFFNTIQV